MTTLPAPRPGHRQTVLVATAVGTAVAALAWVALNPDRPRWPVRLGSGYAGPSGQFRHGPTIFLAGRSVCSWADDPGPAREPVTEVVRLDGGVGLVRRWRRPAPTPLAPPVRLTTAAAFWAGGPPVLLAACGGVLGAVLGRVAIGVVRRRAAAGPRPPAPGPRPPAQDTTEMIRSRHRLLTRSFVLVGLAVAAEAVLLHEFAGVATGLLPRTGMEPLPGDARRHGHDLRVTWLGRTLARTESDHRRLLPERRLWLWGPPVLLVLWGGVMGAAIGRVVSGLVPRRGPD